MVSFILYWLFDLFSCQSLKNYKFSWNNVCIYTYNRTTHTLDPIKKLTIQKKYSSCRRPNFSIKGEKKKSNVRVIPTKIKLLSFYKNHFKNLSQTISIKYVYICDILIKSPIWLSCRTAKLFQPSIKFSECSSLKNFCFHSIFLFIFFRKRKKKKLNYQTFIRLYIGIKNIIRCRYFMSE